MDSNDKKRLEADPDGIHTYEYIANNIDSIDDDLTWLIDNMIRVDINGQFSVSAARFLHAIDHVKHSEAIDRLVDSAIDKDRERAYIGYLLPDLWGADYADRAESLSASDRSFRRIYKRLHPTGM